jgi:glycosyltransferase involved in cell wall biosynthesis
MKILFIYQQLAPYVKKDLYILQEAHEVRELQFGCRKELFFHLLPNLWRLVWGVVWCDATFSWFGKLHAFFAVLFSKIFHKKSVVIAGGDDVAKLPENGYGIFSFWWKRWCPVYIFTHAESILSVSKSTTDECVRNARAQKDKVRLLYHGFDSEKFKPVESIQKEPIVITIGRVSAGNIRKKGLELFVQSAQFLPETKFFLVGPWDDGVIDYLKKLASANVMFTGGLYDRDLVNLCSRAKVYVQVSYHESFGCSIAEAMLCECIPVVSKKAAIPEVTGDCGIYVDELTPKEVANKIREALGLPAEFGRKARDRIVTLFPLEKRREKLFNAVDSLWAKIG